MKNFFLAILLFTLIPMSAVAAPVGPVGGPSLTVGGRVFTDTSNLITLFGYVNTTNVRTTLRKMGASSGYTPSGSKSFKLQAVRVICAASFQALGFFAQTDNDVTINSNTPFTNPIYASGNALWTMFYTPPNLGAVEEITTDFTVANGKFLSMDSGNVNVSETIYAYGYEQ